MEKKDIIVVETNGVNEVEIGNEAKLSIVKLGEDKTLSIKNKKKDTKIRWVWIAAQYLGASEIYPFDQLYSKWGKWENKETDEFIGVYGIGKQYVYSDGVRIKAQAAKTLAKGTIFYAEPFIDAPTLKTGHYIATIDTPKILSAYFARYKDEFKYPAEQGSGNTFTYKSTLKLFVLGHMLPNYTINYHNFALFEVDIFDADGDKKVTDTPLQFFQKSNQGKFTVNTLTELDFVIDEKWREKCNHKEKTLKTFYATIKTTIYSNEDAIAGEEARGYKGNNFTQFGEKFQSLAPNAENIAVKMDKKDFDESKSWGFYDADRARNIASKYKQEKLTEIYTTKDGTVIKNQPVTFQVKYDTMDVILERYEASKTNMFAVVGDVEYSSKREHPCKYSKITIQHEGNKDRPPFILFDEDKKTQKVVDHTNLAFGIVAGEKQETIKILAEGLVIKDHHPGQDKPPICHGVTTARRRLKNNLFKDKPANHKNQEEFKHNTIEDVFPMDKAYVLYPEERTPTSNPKNENTGDETIDITRQSVKFEHINTNEEKGIALKVGYLYNKNYDNRILNFLAYGTDGLIKGNDLYKSIQNAWIFRYLVDIIGQKKLYQSYFVPAGTCRYPNQLINIRVYPDIKWAVNFNYNIDDPLYYQNNNKMLSFYDKAKAEGEEFPLLTDDPSGRIAKQKKASTKKKEALTKVKTDKKNKTKFSLHFEAEANGKSYVKLGTDFAEKARSILSPVMTMYNLVDKVTGAKEARDAEEKIKNSTPRNAKSKGILKRIKRVPMTLELKPPGIGAGLAIGYDTSTDSHLVGHELQGNVKLNPIIGGDLRIDLLALADKIPVYGKLVTALDLASWLVDWLSDGNVEVNYKIDLTFYANLTLPKTYVSYNFATKKFDWQGSVEGTFGGKLELEVGLKLSTKQIIKDTEIDLQAGVKGDCSFKVTVDPREKEMLNVVFSGLIITVHYKLSFSSNGDRKKKKLDPLKLIPSITKSLPIKFD